MKPLNVFLIVSTVLIYLVTVLAIVDSGFNWPAVFLGDILQLNWRSQFNIDFVIHLILLGVWVSWREGFTAKAYVFGFLSFIMGGMFGVPYILYAFIKAKGDVRKALLGVHA